jgi:hypothetical protein
LPVKQAKLGARRRLRELGFRRAGGLARTTRGSASLLGAGGSFRRAQLATGVSGARCSPAAAMATAAGLGCSREERQLGFYRQCALARGITTITHVKGWHGKAMVRRDSQWQCRGGAAHVRRRRRWLAAQVGSARPVSVRSVARADWVRERRCKGWGTNGRWVASASGPRGSHGARAVWRADVAWQSSGAPRVPTLIQLSTA